MACLPIGYLAYLQVLNLLLRRALARSPAVRQRVRLLLEMGASGRVCTADGSTALGVAVWSNDPRFVDLVLARGGRINDRDVDGYTELMYAIRERQTEMARLLLARGADVNVVGNDRRTPLRLAESGNYQDEELTAMIRAADPRRTADDRLWEGVEDQDPGAVKRAIAEGASLTETNDHEQTPLIVACYGTDAATVEVLLEAGSDPTVRDDFGDTPLGAARKYGTSRMVQSIEMTLRKWYRAAGSLPEPGRPPGRYGPGE